MANHFHPVMLLLLAAVGICSACDQAVEFPANEMSFAEDSPARYFGKLKLESETPEVLTDGTELYTFRSDVPATQLPATASPGDESVTEIGRGPACLYGDPYSVLVQRGAETESNNLVIELAGNGACFVDAPNPDDCIIERETAASSWPTSSLNTFLSPDQEVNPLTYDWDRIFLSYCDYSLYAADTNAGPATGAVRDRYFRGTQNFTAGLQVAKRINPNPEKILVAGPIAGGYGAVINTPAVAAVFPNSDIYVVSDSGSLIGIRKGETAFLQEAVEDYNASYNIPDSCGPDCLADGSLVPAAIAFVREAVGGQQIRLALATTLENFIVGTLFLQYDDIDEFAEFLISEVTTAEESFAGPQFGAFLLPGSRGTLSDVAREQEVDSKFDIELNGVRYGDWIEDFLAEDPDWDTVGLE